MNQKLISGRHAALVAVVPVIIYTFIAGMGGRGAADDPGPFLSSRPAPGSGEGDLRRLANSRLPPISYSILFHKNCIARLILVI